MNRIRSIALARRPLIAVMRVTIAVSKKTGANASWIVEVMSLLVGFTGYLS
jgi:hypothetical protein